MNYLIENAQIVNEGEIFTGSVLIQDAHIHTISRKAIAPPAGCRVIRASGLYLFPGMIDDQVHFREPGLTHKAEIYTEAKAAVAGGITSYMEMPNTVPNTLTQELLEEKYQRAAEVSLANYSFYMGASNNNLAEVLKTNPRQVCGVKVFMGSSTGNMLVDNKDVLTGLFAECPLLIATHCEDEATVRRQMDIFRATYGEDVPVHMHPLIRNEEACYTSSSLAVELAEKYNARLHVLHISTAKELSLFRNDIPSAQKRITAEACIHHLWFSDADYAQKGNFIKWNPAVKTTADRAAIQEAVRKNRIDVIATDHAPHTAEEKNQSYFKAPSGGPLVQHAMPALFALHKQGVFSLEQIAEKTAHSVANIFQIEKRGYIREGYFADLVLFDLQQEQQVEKSNILYKCGWSPFEGYSLPAVATHTFVSGHLAYEKGVFDETSKGIRLTFER